MSKKVQINVKTIVNAANIRRETRDGRKVIIVPSATMPDDVIMNNIRYPAAEIAKSFKTLEGTPAPLGHPKVGGKYVSASSPQGMVRAFVGAWNENVRQDGGRVLIDKVIDEEYASMSPGGKSVLEAIEKGEPIHTSTGIYANLTDLKEDPDAKWQADGMYFDHDAILIGEEGAAKPDQGVGIFVNSQGEELDVINSSLWDEVDRDLNWQIDSLARTVERARRIPLIETLKALILAPITRKPDPEKEPEEMDKEQAAAFTAKLDEVATAVAGLGTVITNALAAGLKPLTDQMQANADAQAAKEKADHAAAAAIVVNAGLLDQALADQTPLPALQALAAKAATPAPVIPGQHAFRVHSGQQTTTPAKLEPKE